MTAQARSVIVTSGSRGIGAAVCMLVVESGFGAAVDYASNKFADEIARAVMWFLSDASSYATGSILNVSGGR